MVLVWALLIVGSLVIPTNEDVSCPLIVGGAIVFVGLFSVVFSYIFPASMDRQIRRLYKEGANKGVIGRHELEIDDDGLVERTEVNETRQSWRGVERIAETDEHAFIYISSMAAHVIPKHSMTVGDPDAFIDRAKELWCAENPEAVGKQEA